jgi:hypothetical protein
MQSGRVLQSHENVPGLIREQIYRADRQRLDRPRRHNGSTPETSCPPINITNVLPTQTPLAARSSTPPAPENTTPSIGLSDLQIPGLLDDAVRENSIWKQSPLSDEALKTEVKKGVQCSSR